jgi:uncharacterized protein YjbI with pentapeptide repeats
MLLRQVTGDALVECGSLGDESERAIHAELIEWLSTKHRSKIDRRGIRVEGARIIGELNLTHIDVPFPLSLRNCRFDGNIRLSSARLSSLDLSGSHMKAMIADRVTVVGSVYLNEGGGIFEAEEGLHLIDARIGGNLDVGGASSNAHAKFGKTHAETENDIEKKVALNVSGADVGGSILLRKISAAGVRLNGARINADLFIEDGQITRPPNPPIDWSTSTYPALHADSVDVRGSIFLNRADVQGIRLAAAKIGNDLYVKGGKLTRPGKEPNENAVDVGLYADGIVATNIFVQDNTVIEGMWFRSAEIKRELEIRSATFSCSGIETCRGTAINATGAKLGAV